MEWRMAIRTRLPPFLCRVVRKYEIRVTGAYAISHPNEWLVTCACRSFLPSRGRIPPFKIDASRDSAFGPLVRKAEIACFACLQSAQIPIENAIEMAHAFRLPVPCWVTFAEVQHRPSSKSVSEMIIIGGMLMKEEFPKNPR